MERMPDVESDDLKDWLGRVREKETTQRLVAAIAYKRGVARSTIAEWYGWPEETVDEWFDEFESKPLAQVIDETERFNRKRASPFLPEVRATVEYLNYEVLADYGWGLDDDDLFEKAHDADLSAADFGRIAVAPGESILAAAENQGFEWPYSCRGGACSNCAVILTEGEIAMPGDTILPDRTIEEHGARLTCVGVPASEEIKLVFNAKHHPDLAKLRLPSR